MRNLLTTVAELSGMVLIAVGAGLYSPAIGLIVAGVLLLLGGIGAGA